MDKSKFKYKKTQKVKCKKKGYEYKRLCLRYGVYGLQALDSCRLTEKQLESTRRTIKKVIKKEGIIWSVVDINRFVTSKPLEVRMGKGKGNFDHGITLIYKGTVIFELGGKTLSEKKAKKALELAGEKIPIKTRFFSYKT